MYCAVFVFVSIAFHNDRRILRIWVKLTQEKDFQILLLAEPESAEVEATKIPLINY